MAVTQADTRHRRDAFTGPGRSVPRRAQRSRVSQVASVTFTAKVRLMRLGRRAGLTGLHDVGGHDLAAGYRFGALIGLDGSVRIVRAEHEADLVAGLAGFGDRLLSGVGVAC